MPTKLSLACALVALAILPGATGWAKECSRLVTERMRANALANARRYAWATSQQQAAVNQAERWVRLSDEALWKLVPSQELPRDIYCSMDAGCPTCGKEINRYGSDPRWPYDVDLLERPWRIRCPHCKSIFPANDFGAFYETALDEHGFFRHSLGDRALLFNAAHPDPSDPQHALLVDDGHGMVDAKGNRFFAVAYYCQWGLWRGLYGAVTELARAYALTSDRRYAHKCAVLLDRIADVYPEMDWRPMREMGFRHSDGGTARGRIEGCIWETAVGEQLARGYDLIYDGLQDDQELVGFCGAQAARYGLSGKDSIASICRHIEDHLLLEVLKSVKDGRIEGNTGMTHLCLANAAIALDRPGMTNEWLAWLFDPAYPVPDPNYAQRRDPVPWAMVEGLDRDGMGGECGGYGLIWTRLLLLLAETLAAYPDFTAHDMVREYPKLRQSILVEPRLMCLDAAIPNIGDTGATGLWQRVGSVATFARGFRLYSDPRMAQLAWHYGGRKAAALRLSEDIFEADPEARSRQIAALAGNEPFRLQSDYLGRYGQAILQTESPVNGRAAWIHYGAGKGHSHRDSLTIGLYAHNLDMLPDHGYPEYCDVWPPYPHWTANTISHSTLLVDDAPSAYSPGGQLQYFADQPPLRAVEVAARGAYPALRDYRRLIALVDASPNESYLLDIFRARGGSKHRLITCGPGEAAAVKGVELAPQGSGTFAGPDAAYMQLNGERAAYYQASGFTFLYDVARSPVQVDRPYTVDWQGEDLRGRIATGHEPHLRLHALTPAAEVALASGDPPQNKPGNPRRLRYLLQSREGQDLTSEFVSVLEPYDRQPFIRRVRPLQVTSEGGEASAVALAVELASGATDILVSCEPAARVGVAGGIVFEGRLGMVRTVAGRVTLLRMVSGTLLRCGDLELTMPRPAYTGRVVRVDVSDPGNNLVALDPPLPGDASLVGQSIHFRNALPEDTSYRISAVTAEGVSTGEITLVQGFRDAADFGAGYRYLVNPGDAYEVPCVAGLDW